MSWQAPPPPYGDPPPPLEAQARRRRRGAAVARGLSRTGVWAARTARRAADAQGADVSGLNRLLEVHAVNAAADAAVAISLAGSLFATPATGGHGGRGSVALYLLLTMLPFAVVAPLLGPFLDRFAHGRRWAIGGSMAARAFLCWVLATALPDQTVWMFPAALGILVMSKAYGVTKAAAVPRLIPDGFTLVKTNGRVSMAGIVGVGVSAPMAGLMSLIGAGWVLRWAFVLFVIATIASVRLPSQVDHSAGEEAAHLRGLEGGRLRIPPPVTYALRANCAPKWMSGFMLMFMSFLLQKSPLPGWSILMSLGVLAAAAGAGNLIGVTLASLVRNVPPRLTVSVIVVADAVVSTLAALHYGTVTLIPFALTAGMGQALAKFALDSTIQKHIPPHTQTSAFARAETALQLAWVVGGFVGIALPLNPQVGMWTAAVVLGTWGAYVLSRRASPPHVPISETYV